MTGEEIGKVIEDAVTLEEGIKKLSCAKAFIIADDYGVKLSDISRYCNSNKIKISNCQLGCFR
ncbi:MAG: hypothetical protein JW746_02545 [Candidatus Krumholzibacteriota bacterium]|nr:hypothetical protein [Candidatus Krumholzibacteriota bacterium]